MTRPPTPTLRVVSIAMADGSDINSPAARAQIARALLSIPVSQPVPSARQEQSAKTNAAD
ncbi:hypothetical protein [Deinococcus sp. QL22]|uniref:hypothetical protein n=1 Tax=Deinococcus sp. QL22 TaxID=2939437 RepID=UPI00201795D3|nr:hypothetical protein [Deinococcus sp. QL22]UQN06325.1 hypothetical protein M1R55_15920 [Deinococcus sp. QL22]